MRHIFRIGFSCFALSSFIAVGAMAQQHHSYVADANREYAAIFSHTEKVCASEQTTSSYGDCIGKEVAFTEAHLASFLTAIRGIASQDDAEASATPSSDRKSEVALINQANAAWQQYRKNICDLTAAGMAGGSGEGNTATECIVKMDREYAHQLADAVYLHILAE